MSAEVDLTGHYDLIYSPDDEAQTGKGYWVELTWKRKNSPLFKTREQAAIWAARNGGRYAHYFDES